MPRAAMQNANERRIASDATRYSLQQPGGASRSRGPELGIPGICPCPIEYATAMIAAGFSLLLSALLVLPASFVAPKGWTARTPPASSPVDFIWLSPGFGVSGNGENLTAMSHPVPSSTTLG